MSRYVLLFPVVPFVCCTSFLHQRFLACYLIPWINTLHGVHQMHGDCEVASQKRLLMSVRDGIQYNLKAKLVHAKETSEVG